MDQMTMFYEPEPPAPEPEKPSKEGPKDLKATPELPVAERAGTPLDHRWCSDIFIGKKQHGVYDQRFRVYQTGGQLSRFVYWKKKLVSLDARVWRQIIDKADWIEIIDHERNECWRISSGRARAHAVIYDAGIGERIGVPLEHWTVYDSKGRQK